MASPARMGIAFVGVVGAAGSPSTEAWFQELCAAGPAPAAPPRAIDEDAVVYLGAPPEPGTTFAAEELRLLQAVGRGATVRDLLRAAAGGPARHLFALLARSALTLARPDAAQPATWRPILDEAEARAASADGGARKATVPPAPGGDRPAEGAVVRKVRLRLVASR